MLINLTKDEINMLAKITAYYATELRKADISGIKNSEIGYTYMPVVNLWSKLMCINTTNDYKKDYDHLYKFFSSGLL